MRRRVWVPLAAVLTAGALAIGTSVVTAGASVASAKAPVCAGKTKKKAIKDIKKAFDYFLNGTVGRTSEDKIPFIEDLDTDTELLAQFTASAEANAAQAATTSVKVNKVTCAGKKEADVEADLVLNGTPTPGILLPSTAVLVGKVWKVSKASYCDLAALGDPTILESGPCAG